MLSGYNKKAKKRDDDIDMTHVNEVLRSDVEAAKETLRKEEEALEGARMEEEASNYEIKIRLPLQQDWFQHLWQTLVKSRRQEKKWKS